MFEQVTIRSAILGRIPHNCRAARIAATVLTLSLALTIGSPSRAAPQPLIPVKLNGKWGLLDRRNHVAVPIKYDMVLPSAKNGDTILVIDNREVMVNASGNIIIPASKFFMEYFDLNGLSIIYNRDRSGLINRNNIVKWQPIFSELHNFDGTLYVARLHGHTGVLSLTNHWSIEPLFYDIGRLAANGLARAKPDIAREGFIDRSGNWIIPPGKFEKLWDFGENGLAPAELGGKWGFINARGNWVIPPQSEADVYPNDFDASGVVAMKIGGLYGFMDHDGRLVIQPQFEEVGFFSGGYFPVRKGGKWGVIDAAGNNVIAPRYDQITNFHAEGLATVTLQGKSWIVDRKGEKILGDTFEALGGFSGGGWAAAKSNGKWGAIDTKGRWLVKPIYDCVDACFDEPPPPVYMIERRD